MLWQRGKAYSQDLRDRVFAAADAGTPVGQIADMLLVRAADLAGADAPGVRQCDADVGNPGAVALDAQKKTLHAAEQNREDVAKARGVWRESQSALNSGRLIFIDETWAKTNMVRPRGR